MDQERDERASDGGWKPYHTTSTIGNVFGNVEDMNGHSKEAGRETRLRICLTTAFGRRGGEVSQDTQMMANRTRGEDKRLTG
jgi:hypothetical protein